MFTRLGEQIKQLAHLPVQPLALHGIEPPIEPAILPIIVFHSFEAAQQLAHATANGAVTRPGDLFASGTISGSGPASQGSFIELAWNGERPIALDDGETRAFLQDGDEITLRGWCERPGARRIGFGRARGRIEPSTVSP